MSKRKETLIIENALQRECRQKRIYGCEEVTIGFANGGYGGRGLEIVDFMTMDSKGVLKCYEIKITFADLKSSAKKSWFGHFNYLIVSKELLEKVQDWSVYIPAHVGIKVATFYRQSNDCYFESIKKAQRCNIPEEQQTMLKESLVRSMYWKMEKFRDAADMEKTSALNNKIRELEKRIKQEQTWRFEERGLVREFERLVKKKLNLSKRVHLEEMIETLKKEVGIMTIGELIKNKDYDYIEFRIPVVKSMGGGTAFVGSAKSKDGKLIPSDDNDSYALDAEVTDVEEWSDGKIKNGVTVTFVKGY